jgi:hypothetical protein
VTGSWAPGPSYWFAVVLTLIRACDLATVIEVDPGASR